jgi:ABC-type nitrate/sulfonate/bicarbonate transport system permease component
VAALYASPQVAFLPLLIIWLGIGFTSKVALVFIGSVIIMIINTETGVAQVDPRLIETARSFTASERQVLTKIVLPAALPIILAGMRLSIGRALVMVVVAEIYASNRGLGYLIFQASGMLTPPRFSSASASWRRPA